VQDKYFSIGVELEVGLTEIYQLEAKYRDNRAKIFSEVLQCWMDNCSRKNYIHDICSALEAVSEHELADSISRKYSQLDGESFNGFFLIKCNVNGSALLE